MMLLRPENLTPCNDGGERFLVYYGNEEIYAYCCFEQHYWDAQCLISPGLEAIRYKGRSKYSQDADITDLIVLNKKVACARAAVNSKLLTTKQAHFVREYVSK